LSRFPRALLVLPALACMVGGCTVKQTLSADEVAKSAEDALEKQVGQRPDITCPDDVEAKVGNKTRCTLTAKGLDGTYGVTVTIKSVKNGTANFDVLVDDKPQG
jgi:phage tail sheath gpL-like